MNTKIDDLAWSVYWAQDQLHSCVPAAQSNDQQCLTELWQDFAKTLSEGSTVLDLATGNGAVPVAMLSTNSTLQLIAVDQAEIDPRQFVSNTPQLDEVEFHPSVAISDISFNDETMDAITSQFGLEYAGIAEASAVVFPKLKSGGELLFVIHNTDSEILATSAKKIEELEQLLKLDGPIEKLMQVLQGKADFHELENAGRTYLQTESIKTEMISGQVFGGIEAIASKIQSAGQSDIDTAVKMGASLSLRVNSELSRLIQMRESAQDEQQMQLLKAQLEKLGANEVEYRPLYVDQAANEYLLAWVLKAVKA